jgi:K+-sensing histidine kinase KdpD
MLELGGRGRLLGSGAGLSAARRWSGLVLAVLGLPALTLVLVNLRGSLALGSMLLLYLLAVVVVCVLGGLAPGLVAVLGSLFAANWFLTPPYHTLAVQSRDSIIELIVFGAVAVVVSLTMELAAREERARAGRSEHEARLLSGFAALPAGELSLLQVLEQVRVTFGMTSAALVRHGTGVVEEMVVTRVGPPPTGQPSLRVAAGEELELVAYGPELFAEDRQVLKRLAAAAARAWEGQRLAAHADQLAELDRVRTALLAAVGHDLRTPLAGLKAAVSSLRQDDVEWSDAESDELFATIEDSADRLTEIIANLLDMSRIQAGALTVRMAPVAVDEVVSRALLDVPGGNLSMEIPDDLPMVMADGGLLERVVANLVDNAVRYGGSDTPVAITAVAGDGEVVVQVVDHGPGVPADEWPRVFVPFQRLGDHSVGSGAGLGLAIVKGFCDATGVSVIPSRTPGGGLTMTLVLPEATL